MAKSLELIRVKIAELEAKLTDLRIAERELVALEPELARKTTRPRAPKPKPIRTEKVASPARQTISAAIAEVLNAHGALPAVEIAEYIKGGGPRDWQANHLPFVASVEETGPGEDPRRKMDAAKGTLEACVSLMMQIRTRGDRSTSSSEPITPAIIRGPELSDGDVFGCLQYAIAHQLGCFEVLAKDIYDADKHALAGMNRFLDDAERPLAIPFTRELSLRLKRLGSSSDEFLLAAT